MRCRRAVSGRSCRRPPLRHHGRQAERDRHHRRAVWVRVEGGTRERGRDAYCGKRGCAAKNSVPGVKAEAGFFLSIEGLDGSGKSSQIERLCEHLRARGYDVLRSREPGGCPIAEEIRRLVLDPAYGEMCAQTEALLYAAGRAQHVRQVVRPALEAGKVAGRRSICRFQRGLSGSGARRGLTR